MTQPQRQSVQTVRSVRLPPQAPRARLAPVVSLDAERQKRLVAEYTQLVERLVSQTYSKVHFRFSRDELRSAAWLGLFEAHRRFDGTRGIPFAAFAHHRVAGAILDEVRGRDHLARPSRRRQRSLDGVRERLTRRLQREPTDFEVARVAGEDFETFHVRSARQRAQSFLALDDLPTADRQSLTGEDAETPLDLLCRCASSEALATAMRRLPERQQRILALYYGEEKSYKEIGRILGVTESRICQIVRTIHAQLREGLDLCA